MSIVGNCLYGWDHLEPVLMGTLAKGMNILLLGSHGCGKSLFAKFVSTSIGNGEGFKFIKYAMDKENLLSMVGCPNPEEMKKGKISYCTHERSIFNADVIMLDELTRAGRENQNMVLEILEEKTVFGMPLKYRFAIATANEETYRGAYKIDAALLDRFYVVLPVPSIESKENNVGAEEIAQMIALNQGKREENLESTNKSIQESVAKIRQIYDELWANKKIHENVNDFTSKFFSSLLTNIATHNKANGSKDTQIKVSFRQISNQFVPLLFSIASYYKAISDDANYLQSGAWDAIKYSICTKLSYPAEKVIPIFDTLKDLLIDGDTLMSRINIAISTGSLKSRIDAIQKYAQPIKERMEYAEKINIIGNIVNDVKNNDNDIIELIRLNDILATEKINDQVANMIKLRLFGKAIEKNGLQKVASFF